MLSVFEKYKEVLSKDPDKLQQVLQELGSMFTVPHPQGSVSENFKVWNTCSSLADTGDYMSSCGIEGKINGIDVCLVLDEETDLEEVLPIICNKLNQLPPVSQISKEKVETISIGGIRYYSKAKYKGNSVKVLSVHGHADETSKIENLNGSTQLVGTDELIFEEAAEEISRLEGEDKWISVEERLPEPNVRVKVKIGCTSMGGTTYKEGEAMIKENGRWTAGFDWCRVRFWKPLK